MLGKYKIKFLNLIAAFVCILFYGISDGQFGASPWTVTTTQTVTVPAGVGSITVYCIGGGGAGGGSGGTNANLCNGGAVMGGGGGGGAINMGTLAVVPGANVTITIGNGGTGVSFGNGNSGGPTSVTVTAGTVSANGGSGGGVGTLTDATGNNGTAGASGAGGAAGLFKGGNGGVGYMSPGNCGTCLSVSGGGGGSAGSSSAGGNATTSTVTWTSPGGSAGTGTYPGAVGANGLPDATLSTAPNPYDVNGNPGTTPGSGGSGSSSTCLDGIGGAGAKGEVVIVYVTCTNPSITVQPSTTNQNGCLNFSPTVLSVTATGTALTYQWYSNAANSNVGGTLIAGATSSTYTPVTSSVGTLYYYCIIQSNAGCPVTTNVSGSVNVITTPAIPGAITGTTAQCPGLTSQAYSISAVGSATTYTWGVPAGWTITGGAGTTAITVTTGGAGQNGNITVTAGNACGTSAASSLAVTVNPGTPTTPGAITGTATQCPGLTSQTYSVTAVANATTYTWSVPAGWTITSGTGTNSINVTTGTTGQNGNITVTAGNSCGTSAASSLAVTVSAATPATPGAITGTTPQCPSVAGQTYSITAVANATTYTWAVPAGWTITAGAGTTSITVTSGTNGQNGNITVTAGNSCGTSAASTKAVTVVTTPATPGAITGTTTQCPTLAGQTYSITAVANATTYTWGVPAGWTITAGAGTTSITVTTGTVGQNGNITVTAGNSCGTSAASSQAVTVVAGPPATPGAITGTASQCPSVAGLTYSISAVANATTYTWGVPAGWTITAGAGTTSITVTSGTTGQNGNITVTAGNGCGNSASSSLAVTVIAGTPGTPGAITGTTPQCPSLAGQTYSISAVANATTYTWGVPAGWSVTGGGGTSITVTTGTTGQNGNITVTASNSCGTSAASSLAVTVIATPVTPGAITGTAAQCASYVGQTYSISAVANATTYTWAVPAGWSITAGAGTTSITVTTGTAGQNGNITVTAGNSCGTSAASSLAVTSTACIPPTPTSSAATNADCGSFFANWSSSTGATTYYLDVSTSNTFASFVTGYNNYSTGLCTSYFVSGLSASTTYYYRVRSANGFGSSASSATQTVTTTAACSGNLATWQKVGAGTGGGVDHGDPAAGGDFEVAAEVADNTDNVLFIGGYFTQLGNSSALAAACIGEWTPSTTYPYTAGTWSNIGNIGGGLLVTNGGEQNNPSEIFAMAYFNGILYIGGNFTTINGSATDGSGKSYNNLAKYTIATSTWSAVGGGGMTGGSGIGQAVMYAQGPLGGGGFYVQALTVDNNGNLYVGGNFTSVAGVGGYHNIAMWNGTTWSNLSGGMTGTNSNSGTAQPTVYALDAVDNTHVYAGGQFTTAGATSASNIAMWNGASWSALGAGIPQNAYYANGCGGVISGNPSWSSCPVVAALANNGTLVYAGGAFSQAGAVSAENIAQWNQGTSTWADIGGAGGASNDVGEVVALTVSGGILYVGGDFQDVNNCGLMVNNIAEYDGWAAMPSTKPGFNPGLSNVLSVAVLSGFATAGYGIVYAGGDYEAGTDATGHPTVNHIAQYAGAASGPSILPITLLSFDAQYNGSSSVVDVTWTTASEINNKEFTIEKSMDGMNWEFVANVPGAGNSTRVINYASVDESPFGGISYYRLKQTDYDGNHTYSDIRAVEINASFNKMEVVPNPARNHTNIIFGTSEPGVATVSIYDCAGRLISSTQVNTIKGINTTELDITGYNNGVYFVAVNGALQQYTAKFVVIR